MAHDVFISHSVKDKAIADAICTQLESEGVRCWIAPRDVTAGMEWGAAIIGAIKRTRIMVLVFTANANASQQIRREVERAVHHEAIIVPFRVEKVVPDESLEYFIGNVHWLDAITPPLEAHLENLAETIKVLLARIPVREEEAAAKTSAGPRTEGLAAGAYAAEGAHEVKPAEPSARTPNAPKAAARRSSVRVWIGVGALMLVLAAVIGLRWGLSSKIANEPSLSAPSVEPPAAEPQSTSSATASPQQIFAQANSLLVEGRFAEGKALAEKACNAGSMDGCSDLGMVYQNGSGVAKDYVEARAFFAKACDGGSMVGCSNLGVMYEDGLGVPKDYARARALYQKACDGGSNDGCGNLGYLYDKGHGVGADYAKARALYQKACDGGNMVGCNNLGSLYENGHGVAKDYARAVSLYQQACDAKAIQGCGNLGNLYVEGLGVTKDAAKGMALLKEACEGGGQWSCGRLKELEK